MKKLFYALMIIPVFLLAGLNVEKVSKTLSQLKSVKSVKTVKFYNANKKFNLRLKNLTSSNKANIVIFPTNKNTNKLQIVDSYKALRLNPKSIGAIYLKKGRTQIVFIEERLKNNGLILSPSYKKHLLSECQINPLCLLTKF
jgi:hypothetical protein